MNQYCMEAWQQKCAHCQALKWVLGVSFTLPAAKITAIDLVWKINRQTYKHNILKYQTQAHLRLLNLIQSQKVYRRHSKSVHVPECSPDKSQLQLWSCGNPMGFSCGVCGLAHIFSLHIDLRARLAAQSKVFELIATVCCIKIKRTISCLLFTLLTNAFLYHLTCRTRKSSLSVLAFSVGFSHARCNRKTNTPALNFWSFSCPTQPVVNFASSSSSIIVYLCNIISQRPQLCLECVNTGKDKWVTDKWESWVSVNQYGIIVLSLHFNLPVLKHSKSKN